MSNQYKFKLLIEEPNEKWVSVTCLTDLKQKKEICYSKFCFEESLKEKKKNKLVQKAKETKKYYSSIYNLIPFKKTIEFEIFERLGTKELKLYYKNEVIIVTNKIKKKKKIRLKSQFKIKIALYNQRQTNQKY